MMGAVRTGPASRPTREGRTTARLTDGAAGAAIRMEPGWVSRGGIASAWIRLRSAERKTRRAGNPEIPRPCDPGHGADAYFGLLTIRLYVTPWDVTA